MPVTKLEIFLQKLVADTDEMWAMFRTQPAQVIANADLTQHERDLLTNGPMEALEAYLGEWSQGRFKAFFIW
jgi:hypothetical protein